MKGANNEHGMKLAAEQMANKLNNDPVLCEKLIPKWELGCRRITPGPGYLESFLKPNCHLTDNPITKITENAVHTADGKAYECDVSKYTTVIPIQPELKLIRVTSRVRYWI